MSQEATRLRRVVTERVLHGTGQSSGEARRAAYDNRDVAEPARVLIDKVTKTAWKVTDDDFAAAKQTMSDDELFELVVAAALGQSTRQLDTALAAVDGACANKEGAA
jgi:hypothetical protein